MKKSLLRFSLRCSLRLSLNLSLGLSLFGMSLIGFQALAALGETSARLTQSSLQSVRLLAPAQNSVTVRESKTLTGTIVREFLNANGIVVAVAWNGPTLPDLKQLLGVHFEQMTPGVKVNPHSHRHAVIHQDKLVIESHGHLRAFYGRAYLPTALPAGFTINDIQ